MRKVTVETPSLSRLGTVSERFSNRAVVHFVSPSSKPQITYEKFNRNYKISERPWRVNGKCFKTLGSAVLEFLTANPNE